MIYKEISTVGFPAVGTMTPSKRTLPTPAEPLRSRADLKPAATVREQLEERLRTAQITKAHAPKAAASSRRTRRRKKRDASK